MRPILTVIATLIGLTCPLAGQNFTTCASSSGSGETLLPGGDIAPVAEFQIAVGRSAYLSQNGGRGINTYSLTSGLSTHLECFARLQSEQNGTFTSAVSYGIGGKLRLPVTLPALSRSLVWAEKFESDGPAGTGRVFPSSGVRFGFVAVPAVSTAGTSVFLGMVSIEGASTLIGGAAIDRAISSEVRAGADLTWGWLGRNSIHTSATVSLRLLPFLALQCSPAYLSIPGYSTWSISAGISAATVGYDFLPVIRNEQNEFRLPTIEELEKDSTQEEKK